MRKKHEYQKPEPDAFMPYVLGLGIIVMTVFFLGSLLMGFIRSMPSETVRQDQQAILSKIAETNERLK